MVGADPLQAAAGTMGICLISGMIADLAGTEIWTGLAEMALTQGTGAEMTGADRLFVMTGLKDRGRALCPESEGSKKRR